MWWDKKYIISKNFKHVQDISTGDKQKKKCRNLNIFYIILNSKNASVYKPLDWSNSYHIIIKTDIRICMNVSFSLFLACKQNDFMVGQICITWRKKLKHDGDSPNSEYEFPVLIKWVSDYGV